MPRYIDADKVVKWSYSEPRYSDSVNDRTDLRDFLLSLPTLSPDEVRGVGKWEKDSDGLDVCSECGEIALQRVFIKLPDKIVDLQMVRSKFCPNCGARMGDVQDALS